MTGYMGMRKPNLFLERAIWYNPGNSCEKHVKGCAQCNRQKKGCRVAKVCLLIVPPHCTCVN